DGDRRVLRLRARAQVPHSAWRIWTVPQFPLCNPCPCIVRPRDTERMPTPSTEFPSPLPSDRCPCLSGSSYAECCGPFLAGAADAPTAAQLMRSRFTAYVVGDRGYLLATWHPSTRPDRLDLDPAMRWYRLQHHAPQRG